MICFFKTKYLVLSNLLGKTGYLIYIKKAYNSNKMKYIYSKIQIKGVYLKIYVEKDLQTKCSSSPTPAQASCAFILYMKDSVPTLCQTSSLHLIYRSSRCLFITVCWFGLSSRIYNSYNLHLMLSYYTPLP